MARWFRSEPMEYISLIVNEDAAHDCLGDLGKMGVIQFTDVSPMHIFGSFSVFVYYRIFTTLGVRHALACFAYH